MPIRKWVMPGRRKRHNAVTIGTRTAHPVTVSRTGPALRAPICLLRLTIIDRARGGHRVGIVLAAVTYLGFLSRGPWLLAPPPPPPPPPAPEPEKDHGNGDESDGNGNGNGHD